MSKSIEFDYKGEHYTLMYTKATVKRMEAAGFNLNEAEGIPVTAAEALWAGSFLARHERDIRKNKTLPEETWNLMPEKRELFHKLTELYNDPIDSMFADPDDESKKIEWTAN